VEITCTGVCTGFTTTDVPNPASSTVIKGLAAGQPYSLLLQALDSHDVRSTGVAISATPTFPTKIVFVTSRTSQINGAYFGGIPANADTFCQARANVGRFAGTFAAFVSFIAVAAKDRIVDAQYVLPDGTEIAPNKAALLSGMPLLVAINVDEYGTSGVNANVLTGSYGDGTTNAGSCCNNWTSNAADHLLELGYSGYKANLNWLAYQTAACSALFSVYCFQQ
jgi:hypothetical protein